MRYITFGELWSKYVVPFGTTQQNILLTDVLIALFLKAKSSFEFTHFCFRFINRFTWPVVTEFIKISYTISTSFKLAIHKSQFMDQLCLFADHFKQVFVKFPNQNFHSVRTFVSRETKKFLLILQAWQFVPKSVKLYNIFLNLDSILAKIFGGFGPKHWMGELTVLPQTP